MEGKTITPVNQQLEELYQRLYIIKCEVLEGGTLPCKAHASDAGFDVFATDDITIYPGQVQKHPLNIKLEIPSGAYVSIESKSGLGAKGLLVYAGVIDQNYRGVPHVVMSNIKLTADDGSTNSLPLVIKKGQKLAQLIPYPFTTAYQVRQVESVGETTDRGSGGFGSSGV